MFACVWEILSAESMIENNYICYIFVCLLHSQMSKIIHCNLICNIINLMWSFYLLKLYILSVCVCLCPVKVNPLYQIPVVLFIWSSFSKITSRSGNDPSSIFSCSTHLIFKITISTFLCCVFFQVWLLLWIFLHFSSQVHDTRTDNCFNINCYCFKHFVLCTY